MLHDISEVEERLLWVDSLKGIAICAVVWVHSGGGNLGISLDPLGKAGAYWVEMFLILTVYLTYGSLMKKYGEDQRFYDFKWDVQWFLERIWKLTPLYYFMLLVYLTIVPSGSNIWLGSMTDTPTSINIVMHLLYLHGLFPYYANSIMWVEWYLGTMVIYLVLLPVMCRLIRRRRQALIGAALCIIASIMITGVLVCFMPLHDQYIWEGWVYTYGFLTHMPSLAFGILLYFLDKLEIRKIYSNLMFVFSVAGYMLLSWMSVQYADICGMKLVKSTGYSFIFLLFILSKKAADCTLLNNFIWQSIGKNSYGIYLIHFLLIFMGGYLISDELAVNYFHSLVVWHGVKFIFIMGVSMIFSMVYNRIVGRKLYEWGKRKLYKYFASY